MEWHKEDIKWPDWKSEEDVWPEKHIVQLWTSFISFIKMYPSLGKFI